MNLIQLDQLAVLGNGNSRGWLEWDGVKMFLAASPSGIEPPPLPPEIPPVVVDPVDPTPENPNPNPEPTVPVDATTETVYTDPGTYQYIVPKGITKIDYVLIAAGGAGGTGYQLNWNAGGGGQAGQIRVGQIAVKAGDVISVTIGSGGAPRGSAGSSGNPGAQSSLSVNGNVVVAYGGEGGGAGAPGSIGGGGYNFWAPGFAGMPVASVEVLGGGNVPGGWGNVTNDVDAYGVYTAAYGSKPHKNGGRGGTNGLGAGGEGGPWSWDGPGPEVSPGRAGGWPGGGGGGGGSDEGTGIAPGGYGANGGAYLFTGQGYLRRFPSGVSERSPIERAGANTRCSYSYDALPVNDNNGCCVADSTLIHTPSGDFRIDTLTVGDAIYSYDLEQDAVVPNVILGISVHERKELFDVYFADGRVLSITDDHPMLCAGGWASFDPEKTAHSYMGLVADPFDVNATLVELGRSNAIVKILRRTGPFNTYTLSVGGEENTQSFIADYVVVHNRRRCD